MRRSSYLTRRRQVPSINISPLIDMVFLLLIFFVVTSTMSSQLGRVELTPPRSRTATSAPATRPLRITIDRERRLRLNQVPVTWRELPLALGRAAADPRSASVAILADRQTPLALVLRVLDTVRLAGFSRVAVEAQVLPWESKATR